MIANYHTHTTRCKHAFGTEREYIEAAIEQGLKILGFSDHVPQPYPDGYVSNIRMDMSQLEDYTDTLVRLRDEYKDDIQILIGYEVEYTRKYFEKMMNEIKKYPLDYIIQGQHFVEDEVEGFYVGSETDSVDRLRDYVDFTIEGMQTGVFTYLAHPDLINFTGDDNIYIKYMSKLVEASIRLNIPLEVNVYGFVDLRHYPCDRFWSMASKMNPQIVVGCDAHKPEVVRIPENIEGFTQFLKRNNIDVGDNVVRIVKP